ncbi:MAG: methyltransferase domain-containing protein [bacterium]|nr:methyltransferase domain-containing protein [bacterium]
MVARRLLSELPARCFRLIRRLAGAVGGRGGISGGKTRLSNINKAARLKESPEQDIHAKRNRIAEEHIKGAGIEIGALNDPVRVPAGANVRYVDRLSVEDLRRHYPELDAARFVDPDIITDGETLDTIEDSSQDFVIANHLLEHCQNPLSAVENMLRVLRRNGILYITIPDKRYSHDAARPVTPYEHLVKDYTEGATGSRRRHFEEWVRYVDNVTDEFEAAQRVRHLMKIGYSIHFHVWTQVEMIEIILNLKKKLKFEIELIYRNLNEVIFILRKTGS